MTDLFCRTPLILAGAFGSGKTEISLSLALEARSRRSGEVVLVDLDLVTPFFRTRDAVENLEDAGVKVLYPSSFPRGVDLPILPPAVVEAVELSEFAVIDLGGGRMGSRVLGGLAQSVASRDGRVVAVVNPFRPMSGDPESIARGLDDLSSDLRLPVDAIIANPNLGTATEPTHVKDGLSILRRGSERAGIPIIALGVGEHLMVDGNYPRWARDIAEDCMLIEVGRRLRLDWE